MQFRTSHRSPQIGVVLLGAVLLVACASEPPAAPPPPPSSTTEPQGLPYPAAEVAAALSTVAGPLGAITDQPDEQLEPGTRQQVRVAPCGTVVTTFVDLDAIVFAEGLLSLDMEVGEASDEVPGVTAQLAVHHLGNRGEAEAVLAKARTVSCSGGLLTYVLSGISVEGSTAVVPFQMPVLAAQMLMPLPGEEDRAIVVRTQLADGVLADDVTHPVLHGEARLIVVHGPLVVDIGVLVAGPATADESGRLADEATDRAIDLVKAFLGELGH